MNLVYLALSLLHAGPVASFQHQSRLMVADAVYREAEGEMDLGKCLVAAVIVNRVHDGRWPNSIKGVLEQRAQFSIFDSSNSRSSIQIGADDPNWRRSLLCADMALRGEPGWTYNHFHSTAVDPEWNKSAVLRNVVGNHVFLEL